MSEPKNDSSDTPGVVEIIEVQPNNPITQPLNSAPSETTNDEKKPIQIASIRDIVKELEGEIKEIRQEIESKTFIPFYEKFIHFIMTLFPILGWVSSYKKEYILKDIQAGLTVGIICIPGALIYGLIGSVPPIYGLYSTMSGMLLYALLGTSREMSFGATPMLSIVYASAVESMGIEATHITADGIEHANPEFVACAILLAFFSGLIIFLVGFLRLGFLSSLFSQPMISGFTSAAALTIIIGQVKNLLGLKIPSIELVVELVPYILENLHKLHAPTLLLSVITIVVLISNNLNKYFKKFPAPLAMVIVGSLTTLILAKIGFPAEGSAVYGIKVIGDLPSGIPKPAWHVFMMLRWGMIGRILTSSIIVSIICIIETLSVAKYYAKSNGYNIDTNQEMIATGLVNATAVLFNAPPCGGALSRSAINAYSGAKTQLSSIIAFICFFLCILVLTPFFFYVPFCILSAMIIVSCAKLIDFHEVLFTWKVKKTDTFVLVSTFLVVIVFGLVDGALYGIFISLGILIVKMSKSEIEILGRVRGTLDYVKRNQNTIHHHNILVVRQVGDFRYLNVAHFRQEILHLVKKRSISSDPVRAVCVEVNNLRDMDTSIIYSLMELVGDFKLNKIDLYMANMSSATMTSLEKAGFFTCYDKSYICQNLFEAVKMAQQNMKTDESVAPSIMVEENNGLIHIKGITDFYDTKEDFDEGAVAPRIVHFKEDDQEEHVEPSLKMETVEYSSK